MSDIGRRQLARQRREYLYRKGCEHRLAQIQANKKTVLTYIENEKELPGDVRNLARKLYASSKWDDPGPELAALMGAEGAGGTTGVDDEYRWAGVEDPKIVITTSHHPSSRLKMFAKEMKLVFPNSQRINRGNYDVKQLVASCKSNGITDFIVLHETRGRPDHMVVSHMPSGPTAYFTLQDVAMRHDIADCGTMSEAFPNLIFHNFTTPLGVRVQKVLKYLFPVPKEDSVRVMSFINCNDWILFRHHTQHREAGGNKITLTEIGPEFSMMCHKIILGTLDEEKALDVEYVMRPHLNTAYKRLLLSHQPPWADDDDVEGQGGHKKQGDGAYVPNKGTDVAK